MGGVWETEANSGGVHDEELGWWLLFHQYQSSKE
jgi:hypothetical protein